MEINNYLANKLQIENRQVNAVLKLLDEGCSIPFIARYRKEETKNEELQEEVEATDVVTEEKVEEQPQEDAQNEELQKALERAEDFENK